MVETRGTSGTQWILLAAVSNWLLCGRQRSSWKRPGRRVHAAGQALVQGLPPDCMYESVILRTVFLSHSKRLHSSNRLDFHFWINSLIAWVSLKSIHLS